MSLAVPDVNVWLALASDEHSHRAAALSWWEQQSDPIAFCRITQMGLLRLLTTAVVMNQKPLSMKRAWTVYDTFLTDARVELLPEPPGIEREFRRYAAAPQASPKVWADAYLLAFAAEAGGVVVTFDDALYRQGGSLTLRLR